MKTVNFALRKLQYKYHNNIKKFHFFYNWQNFARTVFNFNRRMRNIILNMYEC